MDIKKNKIKDDDLQEVTGGFGFFSKSDSLTEEAFIQKKSTDDKIDNVNNKPVIFKA